MKFKLGIVELPEPNEVAKLLEQPKVTEAEAALDEAKKAAAGTRKELAELTGLCESLPSAIVEGRAPQSSLQEAIDGERSAALLLKSREAEVAKARENLETARGEARALVIAEAASLLEHLKKVVGPILPALEHAKNLEYETERLVTIANKNPETGLEFPRGKPLPIVEWPQCVLHEQAARSWMETAVASSMQDVTRKA